MTIEFIGMIHHRHAPEIHPQANLGLDRGAAGLTGARGNTSSLVGTPRQLGEALVDYHDLGVTTFLIRDFDPLDDMIGYGRDLLPLTKQLIPGARMIDSPSLCSAPRVMAGPRVKRPRTARRWSVSTVTASGMSAQRWATPVAA